MSTRTLRARVLILLFAALACQWPIIAAAQDATPASTQPLAATAGPPELASPRQAMMTFIEGTIRYSEGDNAGMTEALKALDLSRIDKIVRGKVGRERAFMLKEVLDRTALIDYEDISDSPGAEPYVLPVILNNKRIGQIAIDKIEDGGWKFTDETIHDVPELMNALAKVEKVRGAIAQEKLPLGLRARLWISLNAPFLREERFFLQTWQWLGILLTIFAGIVIGRVATSMAIASLARWMRSMGAALPSEFLSDIGRPFLFAATTCVWSIGLAALSLPEEADVILLPAAQFIFAAAVVWTLYRLVDVLGHFLHARAGKTDSAFDDLLVPIVTRTLKIFVVVAGIVQIAQIFQWNINQMLAGLGLGGLAFALAAKDTVSNLFGSLTVLLDKPFKLGDWVVFGGAEGMVESLGIRSTRIRTFYNSLITVPNSELINTAVDNYGEREYRRISCKLSITYDTPPEKIEAFCEGIRELIRAHPYTRKDYYHVWLNEFADSSLNVLLYCFHKTPDWATELRERHRLFLDIIRLARKLGVEFAFPTQTLHMHQAPPPPDAPDAAGKALIQQGMDPLVMGRDEAQRIAAQSYDSASGIPAPVTFTGPGEDVNKKVGGDLESE